MTRPVRILLATSFAVATFTAAVPGGGVAAAEPAVERPPAVVPLVANFRRCDFSSNTYVAPTGFGRGVVTVRPGPGDGFTVDVDLATARPGTRYDVRLIQAPRPSSGGCGAGDPGVLATVLLTDPAGNGSTSVSETADPGYTGVWVYVSIPDEFSQTPDENYTSDVIAAV